MPKQATFKQQLSRLSPLSVAIILLFAAAMTYFLIRSFAASGTATMYTSPPGTQSVTNGQTFSVNIRVSSGASVPVTCAETDLSYPTDKLQVTGESYAGSPYTTEASAPNNSGGVLQMTRCALPAIAGGDQLFAQVSFKAIATGSAAINFTGSSVVTSGEDDSNILTQKAGVTYNISAPATPPPSSGTSAPPSSSGGSSGSSGSTKSPATSSGGTKGSTSGSGGSSGGTASGGSSSGAPGSTTNPSTGGSGSGSSDGSDNATANASTVEITVLDSQSKPVEGAEVVINGQTVKTDKNGIAHFGNVPAGSQAVTIKYQGKQTSKNLDVKDTSATKSPQLFKVSITRNKFNPTLLLIPVVILVLAAVFFIHPWDKWLTPAFAGDRDIDKLSHAVVSSDQPAAPTQQAPFPSSDKSEKPGAVYTPENHDKPDDTVQPPPSSGT